MSLINDIEMDLNTCTAKVTDPAIVEEFDDKWFGRRENNTLVLNHVELAYLIIKRKVRVKIGGEEVNGLNEFITKADKCLDKFFWPTLLVYKDLRDRGRRVKVIGKDRFLVKDKHGDLKLVVVLEEGSLREVSSILNDVNTASDNNLGLVYAIVSLQGDLTYYEVSKIEPRKS